MRVSITQVQQMKKRGERIVMITAYDYSTARLVSDAGIPLVLVGDSLGMVICGHPTTLPVTLDEMIYHTRCVAAGARSALVIADMSFGSYQAGAEQAYASAARLMAAGAQMVKLEGGAWVARSVEFLVARGIPVCGHLGLQPQSVHRLGGYKAQGKTDASARALREDAHALALAGADLLVLEMVPAALATELTADVAVPTIGIGAGPGCSGQVLVLYDMLGIYPGKTARFVRNFMTGSASVEEAVQAYVRAVKDGSFPASEHSI